MARLFFCTLLLLLSACDNSPNLTGDTDLLLDSQHGGGGAAWGLANCSACHSLSMIHRNENNIRHIVRLKGQDSCTGCHGSNGTEAPRQCLICHNKNDLPEQPMQSGTHQHDFVSGADQPLQDRQCLACHLASDMNGRFDINRDLSRYPDANGLPSPYGNTADFCLRCHNRDHQQADFPIINRAFDDPLIAIEDTYIRVDKHGEIDSNGNGSYAGLRNNYVYGSYVECTDCHAMHGTENIKLLIDRSDKGASKLEPLIRKKPYQISVKGDDYSQLCVICHAMNNPQNQADVDTGNGLSGVHLSATSCIECHSHGEAVQAGL